VETAKTSYMLPQIWGTPLSPSEVANLYFNRIRLMEHIEAGSLHSPDIWHAALFETYSLLCYFPSRRRWGIKLRRVAAEMPHCGRLGEVNGAFLTSKPLSDCIIQVWKKEENHEKGLRRPWPGNQSGNRKSYQ
jgi:hypothetical protein